MGLAKQANGLPRFMLDCGWWRNGRRWRRRTLAEMGLHQAGISHANEHGTDGVIPGPADELAEALSLPVKEVRRTVALLLERGAWTQREDEDYEIVDFLDHNPSRADVTADRKRKADRAVAANHQRWHVEKGTTDADCPLCIPLGVLQGSSKDPGTFHARNPNGCMDGMDGWMDGSSSSSVTEEPRLATSIEEEDWAMLEARQRLATRGSLTAVTAPELWLRRTAENLRAEYPDGNPIKVTFTTAPRGTFTVVTCGNVECVNGWVDTDAGMVRCTSCATKAAAS